MRIAINQPRPLTRLHVEWTDVSWPVAIRRPGAVRPVSPPMRLTQRVCQALCYCLSARRRRDHRSYEVERERLRCAPRRSDAFTLIEMLVVIAIIGVLAGLLLSALPGMIDKAKRTAARSEVSNISSAIVAYQNANTLLPTSRDDARAAIDHVYSNDNYTVISILMNDTNSPSNPGGLRNPRRVVYYQPQVAKVSGDAGLGDDRILRDPWRRPYFIGLDLDGDGRITLPSGPTVSASAAIWSLGKDGQFGTKDDVQSWQNR